jgi:L-serine/L-threonine ammonia-lyase
MALHLETPMYQSHVLSERAGRSVWLKMEALQPPGSFKIRGVGYACEHHAKRGVKRFISSSGGNAGIAVAFAGRNLGIPVVVVVPETTTEHAKKLIRQESAEVIVHGASWLEANTLAQSMHRSTDAFIHPFDDPLLWKGHSSLIDEVAQTDFRPDAIVLSVGGGGLMCGVIEGLVRHHWQTTVIAVETTGADSLAQSMLAGRLAELPSISSIATSLGAKRVAQQAFDWTTRHPVQSLVVSDSMALMACQDFLGDHRVLVEPACGAALAVAYQSYPVLQEFENVLMVVCGGAATTVSQLQHLISIHG